MSILSLNQAAKACHKSKAAILEAIRSGRLSAVKDELSHWAIDTAELFRVYPIVESNRVTYPLPEPQPTPLENQTNVNDLKHLLANEQHERDREREQLQGTIDDLRTRLDSEAAERRSLTLLLTYQTETASKQPITHHTNPNDSPLYVKLFGRKV